MLALLATGPFHSATGDGPPAGRRGLGVVAGPFVAAAGEPEGERRRHGRDPAACCVAGLVYGPGTWWSDGSGAGVAVVGALVAHLGRRPVDAVAYGSSRRPRLHRAVFAADFALVTVTMSLSLVRRGAGEVTGPRLPTLLLAGVSCLWASPTWR